jgi:excisionase family DNA binding protein
MDAAHGEQIPVRLIHSIHNMPHNEGTEEAAGMLSISCRALDYLVANKELTARRIGTRVLIAVSDLRRFSRADHPERSLDD